MASAAAKSTARPSRLDGASPGIRGPYAISARSPSAPAATPATAPAAARRTLSVTNRRTSCARLAPRTARTDTSCERPIARTSIRLATFATPTSSTSATPAPKIRSIRDGFARKAVRKGTASKRALRSGGSAAHSGKMRRPMPATSRVAAWNVTPGARRAITSIPNGPRRCGSSSCSAGQTSARLAMASPPGGSTPTTVCAIPSTLTLRPRARAGPPSARAASAWLTTATLSAPGGSSRGSMSRPAAGRTPSARKKPEVTLPVCTRSGSPPARNAASPPRMAPTAVKLRCCAWMARKSTVESDGNSRKKMTASVSWSGFRSTAPTALNTAVVDPIPSASTPTADRVKPGLRRSPRAACRRSRRSCSSQRRPRASRCSSW